MLFCFVVAAGGGAGGACSLDCDAVAVALIFDPISSFFNKARPWLLNRLSRKAVFSSFVLFVPSAYFSNLDHEFDRTNL